MFPITGTSRVDIITVRTDLPNFTGVSLSWLAESAYLINGPFRNTFTKLDQSLWITQDYIFRGPFSNTKVSTIPNVEVLGSVETTTTDLIKNDCTLVISPLVRITDSSGNVFLAYDNVFSNTDYNIAETTTYKIGRLSYEVKKSRSSDIVLLPKALLEVSKPSQAFLLQKLTDQAEYILFNVVMMYIVGCTNIGMHSIYVNLRKGRLFIIAPQKTTAAKTTVEQIEEINPYFYLSGHIRGQARLSWQTIVVDQTETVMKRLAQLKFRNPDWQNRKTIVYDQLSRFYTERNKIVTKRGWPLYDQLVKALDVEERPIVLEQRQRPKPEPLILYESVTVGTPGAVFITPRHKFEFERSQRTDRFQDEVQGAALGGMRKLGTVFYTFSHNEDNEYKDNFTLKNVTHAFGVYVVRGEQDKALQALTEIWRLHELRTEKTDPYKRIFDVLSAIVISDLASDTNLILSTVQQMHIWRNERPSRKLFIDIAAFVIMLCKSPTARDYLYEEFDVISVEDEEPITQLVTKFESKYSTKKDFFDSLIDKTETRPKLLKLVLYTLYTNDEWVFHWLNRYAGPLVENSKTHLRAVITAVVKVFEDRGFHGLTVFENLLSKGSYYTLVYLCHIFINNNSLGEFIAYTEDSAAVEEVVDSLLKGEYDLVLDDYALPLKVKSKYTNSEMALWRDSLAYDADSVEPDTVEELYFTQQLAIRRDVKIRSLF